MKSEDYIDFHAHHPSLRSERVIQDGVDTRGRHPWHLTLSPSHSPALSPSRPLLAIGESGLDRLCHTPYDLQLQVFREEVALSERLQKPLFLHCVRAIDDALAIRKQLRACQPWIWHGYRGNAQQLRKLLPHNFYFSLGAKFYTQTLLACPAERLLLETDDNIELPISLLYDNVSRIIGMPIEDLIRQMQQNYNDLFILSTD